MANQPVPQHFDEAHFVSQYPDMPQATKGGRVNFGFEHHVRWSEGGQRPTRIKP